MMRLAAGFLVLLPCFAQHNTLTPQEKAAGWQLLFDGKSLAGWTDPARKTPPGDSWTVEDGCIKSRAKPRIREDLLTLRNFGNFELLFDWRISPGGNSGVKYRIQDRVFLQDSKTKPDAKSFEQTVGYELEHRLSDRNKLDPQATGQEYVVSFEYQVIDNTKNVDALRGSKYAAGSLYSLVGASREAVLPVGEFNHSRVLVRGKHVEHWLNGVKVVDTTLDAPAVREGIAQRWKEVPAVYNLLVKQPKSNTPIALQNHNDEAWFRNLKIRRLR